MGYTIDAGTVNWARKRVEELKNAEIEFGCALESLGKVPGLLLEAADEMDNQPDSDVLRSYADDVRKIFTDLNGCCKSIIDDRKAISKGIRKFERTVK